MTAPDNLSAPQPVKQTSSVQASIQVVEDTEKNMYRLSLMSGEETPQEIISVNINELDKSHPVQGSFLGILVRNAKATMKLSCSGLKEAKSLWVEGVSKGDPNYIGIKFTIATIGIALYGGSLLFSAAIKAAIWVPVMTLSAVGGVAGGVLGLILSGFKAEGAKMGFKLGSGVVGNFLSMPALLVSAVTVVPRGFAHLFGMLGYTMMFLTTPNYAEKSTEKREGIRKEIILEAALFQATQDSYNLWTMGTAPGDIGICSDYESLKIGKGGNYNYSIDTELQHTRKRVIELLKSGADVYVQDWSGQYDFSKYFKPEDRNKVFGT